MKLKILKYIIISWFICIFIGNIVYKLLYGNSLANILFFKVTVYIQFLLSFINLTILFINSKNYHYLGNILFFLPQIFVVCFLLTQDGYLKDMVYCCYVPFFIVQVLFYFKIKNMFTNLDD